MIDKFFYSINYQWYEESLCNMEMKYLFNIDLDKKYFFSNNEISPSRSPFIKHRISVIYSGKTLEDILSSIKSNNLAYEDFKVIYVKSDNGDVEYKERLEAVNKIGFIVTGFPSIHNPKVVLAVSKVDDTWIFGEFEKNDCKWQEHDKKPHSYSNALSLKMARAIVNIAVGNDLNLKVVDPCCGIGTVVHEGLDIGVNIVGYELSKAIASNARNNIEFFGYDRDIITSGNMHDIKEFFDVAIVDIPYGLFSPVTFEEQVEIIKTSAKIAKKVVLITFENMDEVLTLAGLKVIDKSSISKNRFTRFIEICEHI